MTAISIQVFALFLCALAALASLEMKGNLKKQVSNAEISLARILAKLGGESLVKQLNALHEYAARFVAAYVVLYAFILFFSPKYANIFLQKGLPLITVSTIAWFTTGFFVQYMKYSVGIALKASAFCLLLFIIPLSFYLNDPLADAAASLESCLDWLKLNVVILHIPQLETVWGRTIFVELILQIMIWGALLIYAILLLPIFISIVISVLIIKLWSRFTLNSFPKTLAPMLIALAFLVGTIGLLLG